jgi:hypothetical protein
MPGLRIRLGRGGLDMRDDDPSCMGRPLAGDTGGIVAKT